MPAEENKAALRRAIEHFNDPEDKTGYFELYDESAMLHGYAGVEPGIESIKRFYNDVMWTAFPDGRIELYDVIAEGDEVACRFANNATHTGEFMGLAPTGNRTTLTGSTLLRFEDGKCVERWSQADFLGLMQQLGAIPEPARG